ncbi:hypothetical protein P3342_012913 [Pyrenophora teres f. teres]|nr:hypothetical protein P3342_012913 [Pyrenophora teres f. teres]
MAGPKVHHGAVTGPLSKRQKIQSNAEESSAPLVRQSKIFAPFRTVGLVSPTNVPFTSLPLGKTTFQITTSVGRSFRLMISSAVSTSSS